MSSEMLFIGFSFAYVLFVVGACGVIWQISSQTKIVRLDPPSIDPPPVEYVQPEGAPPIDIDTQKELHIFHLALVHLNGHCSVRQLYEVIKKYHNDLYAEWPELKKLHINYTYLAEVLKKRDIQEPTGRIILVPRELSWYETSEKDRQARLIPHALVTVNGSRVLVGVYHMSQVYAQGIPAVIPVKPVLQVDTSPLDETDASPDNESDLPEEEIPPMLENNPVNLKEATA